MNAYMHPGLCSTGLWALANLLCQSSLILQSELSGSTVIRTRSSPFTVFTTNVVCYLPIQAVQTMLTLQHDTV